MSRVSILTVIFKSEWWIKVRPNKRDRMSKEIFAITNNKWVQIKSEKKYTKY